MIDIQWDCKTMAVRVGTLNNFNCEPADWESLDRFAGSMPHAQFFVNSNINTEAIRTIAGHTYPAVVTVNPDLVPDMPRIREIVPALMPRLAFVRLKWVAGNAEIIQVLDWLMGAGIPTVITMQRFRSWDSLEEYAARDDYRHVSHAGVEGRGWFHLAGRARDTLLDATRGLRARDKKVFICDQSGNGCPSCGNCSRLVLGYPAPIEQLNLSTSGLCNRACPDCYARSNAERHHGIVFDRVYANSKMKGYHHAQKTA